MRIEEIGQVAAGAVDDQGVLREVIRADGEKVDFFCELVADECSRRCLDHDADLHLLVVSDAFLIELHLNFRQDLLRFPHFPNGSDEREHDGRFAIGAGAEDGTELDFEDLRTLQGDADRAQTERRIILFRQMERGGFFVCADVEGTDDDTLAGHGLDGEFINIKLLFL